MDPEHDQTAHHGLDRRPRRRMVAVADGEVAAADVSGQRPETISPAMVGT
jgi:hypothetical protein